MGSLKLSPLSFGALGTQISASCLTKNTMRRRRPPPRPPKRELAFCKPRNKRANWTNSFANTSTNGVNSVPRKKRRRKRKRKKRKRRKRRNKYSVIDHQDFQYGSTNEDYQDGKSLFKIQQLQTLQPLISIFCLH